MSYLVLSIILLTVSLSACAQLALKLGATNLQSAFQSGIIDALIAVALSPLIWVGLIIYGLSVAMWIWVLSKVELSVAYPFVGISFLVTMAFGAFLLSENVTPLRITGTILIASGCILVARSA